MTKKKREELRKLCKLNYFQPQTKQIIKLLDALDEAERKLAAAQQVVNEQAEDEGLWFLAMKAPEAYLQQELRRLHEAVEGKTSEECAIEALVSEKEIRP